MNPETAVATLPPVNWTLEILKLTVPPLLTALAVLIGAWAAYRFANRGRKEDILYKERYKDFEEIATFLSEIRRKCAKYLDIDMGPSSKEIAYHVLQFAKKTSDNFSSILNRQPNRRHLVLLSEETNAAYYSTLLILERLIGFVSEYIPSKEEHYPETIEMAFADYYDILEQIKNLSNEAEACIKFGFKDLDLPRR